MVLPLVAIHGALLAIGDLAAHPGPVLLLLALGFIALVVAVYWWPTTGLPVMGPLLIVACLLRALLLPLPPTLSDDLVRYVWDGRVVAAGANPYLLAPEAEELGALRDDLWQRLPHREVPTVYPPLALGLFSIAARTPEPFLFLKTVLALADLFTCFLLIRLAGRVGLPEERALWYAWNPMVTLEVAGMGHVDALAVAAAVAAVAVLTRRPSRPAAAGAAAALGVLAKLGPLVAIPMWSRQSRHPVRFLLVAVGVLAVVGLPVLATVGGVPPGLITYGVSWEFNGPVYEPLWRLFEVTDLAGWAKAALDRFKQATEQWERWNFLYPYLYPQLLAKAVLGVGMLAVLVRTVRNSDPVMGSGRLFGGLLLCSATLYPWYLLWVLPWAALIAHPAWIALSALILLSYLPQLTDIELVPWIFVAIWLPFWVLLVARSRWSTD